MYKYINIYQYNFAKLFTNSIKYDTITIIYTVETEMGRMQNEYLLQNENFFNITDELRELSSLCEKNGAIDKQLYSKYDVKRGLRDINGKGVLAGLTEISEICSSVTIDGETKPCDGKLYYRGIDVEDIVKGFISDNRFGFEEHDLC